MFGLDVSPEVGLVGGLIMTLTAGISRPQVVNVSFMLDETVRPGCLELALITRILDSLVNSADVPLKLVSSSGLELTEVAGVGLSVVD